MQQDPKSQLPSDIDRSKGTLLLVDDDTAFSSGFSRLLERHAYTCFLAEDAQTALSILREHDIDALISDIHMPGDSGLELIQSARALKKGLPTFLCTGQPTWETAARSIGLSVTGYIAKPPVFSEFLPRLAESVATYRKSQCIQSSCDHLERWLSDLRSLAVKLDQKDGIDANRDYLRITLHHIAVELAELAASRVLAPDFQDAGQQVHNLALVSALRKTVAVLEETRKSFKSKELGELRRQLNAVLAENAITGEEPPVPQT